MPMTWPENGVATLIAVALLVAIAVTVLFAARVPQRWAPAWAVLRGALQLAAISVVLTGVISDPRWVALALLVMFAVASFTSARRIERSRRGFLLAASGIAVGALVALSVVFASGAIELTPRYALALGGIIIGGAMSIATLTGRGVVHGVSERRSEVEGWLALGARPRVATADVARRAIAEALIPSQDQTKTVGLVTLPGAFVGAIFGGLDPIEAGRFQLVVLAAIMAAGALSAVIVGYGLAPRLIPSGRDARRASR